MGGADVGERTAGTGPVGKRISVDELDQVTKNFADRYVLFVANACDDIKAQAVSPEQRRNAHRLKLTVASAAYDIATGPDPVKQLVDMAILVDLHHIVWVEEGRSIRFFGAELGARLSRAFSAAQGEIWDLAERVMAPEQVAALKAAIQEWRRRHPAVEWVSDIRFDVVGGGDGVTLIGGTVGVLTPASGNITDSIGQSRLLGQRAFYYSKRLPRLLDWQAEAALDDCLNVPAAGQLVREVPSILDSVAKLLARLDSLVGPSAKPDGAVPDPRLAEIRQTVGEGKDLAIALRQTAESFEQLLEGFRKLREPATPLPADEQARQSFDISEYKAAAEQFGKAAREASDLLHETRDFAESQSAIRRFTEVMNTVARDLATQVRDTTDHAAWRAAQLIVLSVGLLTLCAGIILWLGRRTRGVPKQPDKGR